jgi:hypothetical protein
VKNGVDHHVVVRWVRRRGLGSLLDNLLGSSLLGAGGRSGLAGHLVLVSRW